MTLISTFSWTDRFLRLHGDEHQVHIRRLLDAGDGFGKAVLPHVRGIIEVREFTGYGKPEIVFRQLAQVKAVIADIAVEVNGGIIAGGLDGLAEGHGAVGEHGGVQPIGAGGHIVQLFPVKNNGELYIIILHPLQNKFRFLNGFLHADSLGEEIHTHLQAVGKGTFYIGLEIGVLKKPAFGIAPVAQTHIGKGNIGLGDFGPVNVPLMFRHIDAPEGFVIAAGIVGFAFPDLDILPADGVGRNALQRRHPDHIKAVVDVDLTLVGVNFLLAAGKKQLNAAGVTQGNVFAMVATEAAHLYGDAWLDGMLDYLREAYRLLAAELAKRLPEAVLTPLEATYLAWIDLRAYGFSPEELVKRTNDHGVVFTEGTFFGKETGAGFLRMNIACPHSHTLEAVKRLEAAIKA